MTYLYQPYDFNSDYCSGPLKAEFITMFSPHLIPDYKTYRYRRLIQILYNVINGRIGIDKDTYSRTSHKCGSTEFETMRADESKVKPEVD